MGLTDRIEKLEEISHNHFDNVDTIITKTDDSIDIRLRSKLNQIKKKEEGGGVPYQGMFKVENSSDGQVVQAIIRSGYVEVNGFLDTFDEEEITISSDCFIILSVNKNTLSNSSCEAIISVAPTFTISHNEFRTILATILMGEGGEIESIIQQQHGMIHGTIYGDCNV